MVDATRLPKATIEDLFPDGPYPVTAKNVRIAMKAVSTYGVTVFTASAALTPLDEFVPVDATAAPVVLTMPLSNTVPGSQFTIKKVDASGNAVTVQCSGAETIDGAAAVTLAFRYQAVTFIALASGGYLVVSTVRATAVAG